MEVQNISGTDIVQNSMNRTPEQTQQTEAQVSEQRQQVVQEENKGTALDSYA
ncbi:MAG: hypothetical protein PF637_08240 [Spirochaetes bacterium]|nr:hypothetical protein [Spirochaetota bacterium]